MSTIVVEALDAVEITYQQLLIDMTGRASAAKLEFLLNVQFGFKPYLGITPASVEDFWKSVRTSEETVHYVLLLTGNWRARGGFTLTRWKQLVDTLADSICVGPTETGVGGGALLSSLDKAIATRATNPELAKSLFMANPWMVTIVLLTMVAPVSKSIPNAAMSRAVQQIADETTAVTVTA